MKKTLTKSSSVSKEAVSTTVVISSLTKKARPALAKLAKIKKIKSNFELDMVGGSVKALKEIVKEAQEQRMTITDPLDKALKATNALFKPFFDLVKDTEVAAKMLMIDYHTSSEEKGQKLLEGFSSGKIKTIGKLLDKKKDLEIETSNSSVRQIKTLEITHLKKIPIKYMIPNESMILEDLKEGIKVPGCKIVLKKSIAI